ncbi:MAG TPA: TfuA-like protein [Myxococcales bacterium]|nr:TfuA-like protein [Myxococcales bacterium]
MIVAFLGPSLPASEASGVRVLPPARQGDVWRALRLRPRAIALIDGVFEQQPSVWHHEILDAIDAGVAVFGGASMGALRAAELWQHGMIGVGQIFRWYRDGVLIDDADVALLHAANEHGYRALTVPQVNVRWAALRTLPARAARAAIDASARIFYQERTWPRALALVPELRRFDLKAHDAREVLRAARAFRGPFRAPSQRVPPPSALVRRVRAQILGAEQPKAFIEAWAREWGLPASEPLLLEHAARLLNDDPFVEGTRPSPASRTARGTGARRARR